MIAPELERRRLGFRAQADQRAYVAAYADHLRATLAASDLSRFIGSSEHIHAWLTAPAQIAALDAFLTAHFKEVVYLLYLRPQEDLVISTYSEAIRRGARHDFATHLARHGRIDHWRRLKPWLEVIGRARLQVRLMVPDALENGDLLDDFCAAAGIDPAGLARSARMNTGLSAGEIALRRLLNAILPVQTRSGDPHPIYTRLLRRLAPLCARSGRLTLSDEQIEDLRARNSEANEKLRRRLFYHRSALF